jgi:3-hydroxymyristoyl/3-hydroxydecanoyl-(acyl carrier protein) dehydratase
MFQIEPLAVEQLGPGQVRLDLQVDPALSYFTGHFPELPILPGVVQLDWAIRMARQYLGLRGEFRGMEQLKFNAVVLPGYSLSLTLEWDASQGELRFFYDIGARRCSSGRIGLGQA